MISQETNITRNSKQHKVLVALCESDEFRLSTQQIKDICGFSESTPMVRGAILVDMANRGLINNTFTDMWTATHRGLDVKLELGSVDLGPKLRTKRSTAASRTFTSSGGDYDGAELRETVHRPGAYDAFKMPSLWFGERRWPDGRRETLIETTRERSTAFD